MSFSGFANNAAPFMEESISLCAQLGGGNNEQEIIKYFKEHPNPSDSEIHALARKMGINKHKFEEIIYKILSDLLRK